MISVSGSLWPYAFLAIAWCVVCALLLRRARSTGVRSLPATTPPESQPAEQPSGSGRDTQAGRI